MKTDMTIGKKIALVALVALVGSCSSDEGNGLVGEPEQQEQGVPVTVVSYARPYQSVEASEPNESRATRAEEEWWPSGFSLSSDHKAIGTFFTTASDTPEKHRLWYNTNTTDKFPEPKWFLSGKDIKGGSFYLYGYMPYNAAEVSITPPEGDTYAEGAVLSYSNLGSVMSKDVCVLVGARHGSDANNPASPGMKLGQFAVEMKAVSKDDENPEHNYLFLLFEHVYARLDFRFKLDADYARLRTIKLKKLELTAYSYTLDNLSDAVPMKKNGSIEVHIQANTTETSPIANDVRFTPDDGSPVMDPVVIFDAQEKDEATGIERGEEAIPSDSYTVETGYVPYYNFADASTKVLYTLRTTYNVYDKQGNLVREKDCVAENTVVPGRLFSQSQLDSGKQYKINLTVMPTYLYVLSEPDIDNPTVRID